MLELLWVILKFACLGIFITGGWILSTSNKYRALVICGAWIATICWIFKFLPIYSIESFLGYFVSISLILLIVDVYVKLAREEYLKENIVMAKKKEELINKDTLTEKEQKLLRGIEKRLSKNFD